MLKHASFALLFAACTGGEPTGATCPTENAPTFESFGDKFFADYCRGCHSANAADRHGAPGSQNYDTEEQVAAHAADIDQWAAAGPGAINTAMPDLSGPVHAAPTDAEREQLGQYLACMQ